VIKEAFLITDKDLTAGFFNYVYRNFFVYPLMLEVSMSENDLLETKGRLSYHLKLYLTVLVIVVICELIGIIKIPVGKDDHGSAKDHF
jgi:hypothetical protein